MSRRDLSSLFARVERELAKRIGRTERELTQVYASVREDIEAELSKVYRKYAVDGELTRAHMAKYNRLEKLEKQINKKLGAGVNSARSRIDRLSRDSYNESFFRHAWAIEQNMGVRVGWGQLREETIRRAVENDLANVAKTRLRERGRERIRTVLAQGLARGDSFSRMSREVNKAIRGTRNDAIRIARTEGQRAQQLGAQDTYNRAKEEGIELEEFWVASLDDRTRVSHGELDGKKKGEKGFWVPSLNTHVEGPLQSGEPEFDIMCRCTTRVEIADLSPEKRRARDEGMRDYVTYEDWKRERGQD